MSEMTRQPVVRLRDGTVRGTVSAGVLAFLGVPYAATRPGANRMAPVRSRCSRGTTVGCDGGSITRNPGTTTGSGAVARGRGAVRVRHPRPDRVRGPDAGRRPRRRVADRVHRVWVDFITRGDPGWAPLRRGEPDHRSADGDRASCR